MSREEPARAAGNDVRGEELAARIRQAFRGAIEPVRAGAAYQLAAVFVAAAMVALPLVYLGLIAAVAWAVSWHATSHLSLLSATAGGYILRLLAYGGPIVIGAVVVAFLLKPFCAPRRRGGEPYYVEPAEAPGLYALVAGLCAAIGAPAPRRIYVDCDANASAAFRRGWRSLPGSDLALTVGLPLAAVLDTRELAGVVAHEFGHFTQRFGMRLTYAVRAIDGWFERVVHQRDRWDEALERWSSRGHLVNVVVFLLARLCVWLSRLVLRLLMHGGRALACLLLRQMEHDADLHEVRVVGAAAFERTMIKMACLSLAWREVAYELDGLYAEGRLSEDLPAHLRGVCATLPPARVAELKAFVRTERTGLLDTHPSAAARVQRARASGDASIFAMEEPAARLFRNFKTLCKAVTIVHYQAVLGKAVDPACLVPVENLLKRRRAALRRERSLDRFFAAPVGEARRYALWPGATEIEAPANARATAAALVAARREMERHLGDVPAGLERLGEAQARLDTISVAERLGRAGLRFLAGGLHRTLAGRPEDVAPQADRERSLALGSIERYEGAARQRLVAGLSLLAAPELAKKLGDAADLRRLASSRLHLLATFASCATSITQVEREIGLLAVLLDDCSTGPVDQKEVAVIEEVSRRAAGALDAAIAPLASARFPYAHGRDVTIATHVIGVERPGRDRPLETMLHVQAALGRLLELWQSLLGDVAHAVLRVEEALGLPPIAAAVTATAGEEGAAR